MKIIKTITELQEYRKNINNVIGFVATMGALHEGHISLIKESKKDTELTIVSIFVNPTQFLKGEDLDKYPKKDKADIKICELLNVDVLFMPDINSMYTEDEIEIKAPKLRAYALEGLIRPMHFDGVLQIVLKLFNLVKPTIAYFGKKDAQQLILIEQMVRNLFLNINIVGCNIVRDSNGLALSSRNEYLSKEEKIIAFDISKSLREATKCILKGELQSSTIIKNMKKTLINTQIEYIHIVTRNLNELKRCEIGNTIILVATKVGKTRLLDNIWI